MPERPTASVISIHDRAEVAQPVEAPEDAPPQMPEAVKAQEPETRVPKKSAKVIVKESKKPITLRPTLELLGAYTRAAGERTIEHGRVVTAQDIMMEVLERARPKVKK